MNQFFGEIPTPLPRTPTIQALNKQRVVVVFATGEARAVELEVCPIPASANVAVSARLDRLSENPFDGLIQYLTEEGVGRIHADEIAHPFGAHLCLDLRPQAA